MKIKVLLGLCLPGILENLLLCTTILGLKEEGAGLRTPSMIKGEKKSKNLWHVYHVPDVKLSFNFVWVISLVLDNFIRCYDYFIL